MSRRFQVFQRFEVKLGFNSFGELLANSRNRSELVRWRCLALETLEEQRSASRNELPNQGGEALPYSGQIFE